MRLILTALLAGSTLRAPMSAPENLIERLATCQTSWLDWKNDPTTAKAFADNFNANFARKGNDGSWAPKGRVLVVGLPVLQAYPQSVGMGVGFSVVVDAPFAAARTALEAAAGKSLKKCDTSDGMRTCELEIAEKRTLTLMSGADPKTKTSLLGCYYYYEK